MKSPSSNQVYLWSKRFGAILLIAMAIVAAGNAQQFSASGKGKVKRRLFSSGKQSLPCNEPASGGATHKRGHY